MIKIAERKLTTYASDVAFVDAEADGSRKENADNAGCRDDEDDGARGRHVLCRDDRRSTVSNRSDDCPERILRCVTGWHQDAELRLIIPCRELLLIPGRTGNEGAMTMAANRGASQVVPLLRS